MERLSESAYEERRDKLRRRCLLSIDGIKLSGGDKDFVETVFRYVQEQDEYSDFEKFATEHSVSVLSYEDNPHYAEDRMGERTLDLLRFESLVTVSNIVKEDIHSFLFEDPRLLGCRMRNRTDVSTIVPDLANIEDIVDPIRRR